ncbi:MAG: hypothetical protein ABNH21_13100 [Glaciecola sp.]
MQDLTKWEYANMVAVYDPPENQYFVVLSSGKTYNLEEALDEFGQGGWECFSIFPSHRRKIKAKKNKKGRSYSTPYIEILFKRKM